MLAREVHLEAAVLALAAGHPSFVLRVGIRVGIMVRGRARNVAHRTLPQEARRTGQLSESVRTQHVHGRVAGCHDRQRVVMAGAVKREVALVARQVDVVASSLEPHAAA